MWILRCAFLLPACLPSVAPAQSILVLEHVHVVPMDREVTLPLQTVVIRDGRISAMGPRDEVEVPEQAQLVDGQGAFLMPGLADMHVHLTARAELLLYVAHGVTTVRNMWGGPDTLELRDRIARGELVGPTIYTTGPILDGPDPRWPHSEVLPNAGYAPAAVRSHQKLGYDAIKVYDGLSAEVYSGLIDRAREAGLPVVGHVPDAVGLHGALEAGQRSIEHLRGYWPQLETEAEIVEAARATAEAGTWNCPTLVVHDLPFAALEELDAARRRPEVQLVPPAIVARWDPVTDARFEGITEMTPEVRTAHAARMTKVRRIAGALHDAGARLLLGTDTPNPFVVPGYSVHQELQQLVSSGLTPFEALRTGTTNAAEFLERPDAGRVAVGAVADLLLVDHNPLEDISATQQIAGVVLHGRWLSRAELRQQLDDLVASYGKRDWFAGMPELPGSTMTYDVLWNETPIGAIRVAETSDEADVRTLHTQSVFTDRFELRRSTAHLETDGAVQKLRVDVEEGARSLWAELTKQRGFLGGDYRTDSGPPWHLAVTHAGAGPLGADLLSHAVIFGSECVRTDRDPIEWILRTPEFEAEFEISETRVALRRHPDGTALLEAAPRGYDMELTTNGFTTRGELLLDRRGMPEAIHLDFPQGRKTTRRRR